MIVSLLCALGSILLAISIVVLFVYLIYAR